MKDALDYAKQTLRFAQRALTWAEADELAKAWEYAYEAGQCYARRKDASERSREAYGYGCRSETEEAARAARAARRSNLTGFWAESWRVHARESAKRAAWCAGYADGVV